VKEKEFRMNLPSSTCLKITRPPPSPSSARRQSFEQSSLTWFSSLLCPEVSYTLSLTSSLSRQTFTSVYSIRIYLRGTPPKSRFWGHSQLHIATLTWFSSLLCPEVSYTLSLTSSLSSTYALPSSPRWKFWFHLGDGSASRGIMDWRIVYGE
jgi:hypothetical protein